MISRKSAFKFFDRGFKETLLLIPGWATDYRIFGPLDLDFNYLMPVEFSPFDFEEKLESALKEKKLGGISILGWSMGGFVASDLMSRCPGIAKEVTFVGVRRSYREDEIERTKAYLRKDKKAFLYKFYHEFFSDNEAKALSWFKGDIMKKYLSDMDLDLLLEDLDYILKARIKLGANEGVRIKFIHGQEDRIAPIEEAMEIRGSLPRAEFISMKGVGHMPFLAADFKKVFSGARHE